MKTKIYILVLLLCLPVIITGCAKNQENVVKIDDKDVKGETRTRSYVESGEFIDVDIKTLALSNAVNRRMTRTHTEEEDKAYAALYRFYSHVTVENDKYICSLKSGKEINISETLFNDLIKSLDDMNKLIEENQAKGERVIIDVPDSTYLESLLQ